MANGSDKSSTLQKADFTQNLPAEIADNIYGYLDIKSHLSAAEASHSLQTCGSDVLANVINTNNADYMMMLPLKLVDSEETKSVIPGIA